MQKSCSELHDDALKMRLNKVGMQLLLLAAICDEVQNACFRVSLSGQDEVLRQVAVTAVGHSR